MVTTCAKANVMQDMSSASSARCLRLSAAFLSGALRTASLAVSAVVRAPGGGGGGGMGTWGSRSSATHTASVMIWKVKPQNVMYLQGGAGEGGEGAEGGGTWVHAPGKHNRGALCVAGVFQARVKQGQGNQGSSGKTLSTQHPLRLAPLAFVRHITLPHPA